MLADEMLNFLLLYDAFLFSLLFLLPKTCEEHLPCKSFSHFFFQQKNISILDV